MEWILFPINHGILAFTGFSVVEPYVVHAPARLTADDRATRLADYGDYVEKLWSRPVISYPRLDDHDESFRLKPTLPAE